MPKPTLFDPPQTWFKIDRINNQITPLPGVIRATKTQAIARTWTQYLTHTHPSDCTYYRSDVFPTYTQAANALANAQQQHENQAQANYDQAAQDLTTAKDLAEQAKDLAKRANNTPNPDAIRCPNGWVYFVTANALEIVKIITPPEEGKLCHDSYRTISQEHANTFAKLLRSYGLTVAE